MPRATVHSRHPQPRYMIPWAPLFQFQEALVPAVGKALGIGGGDRRRVPGAVQQGLAIETVGQIRISRYSCPRPVHPRDAHSW